MYVLILISILRYNCYCGLQSINLNIIIPTMELNRTAGFQYMYSHSHS